MHVKFAEFNIYPTAHNEHCVVVRHCSQLATIQVCFKDGAGTHPKVCIDEYNGGGQASQVNPVCLHARQFWNPQTHIPLDVTLYPVAHVMHCMLLLAMHETQLLTRQEEGYCIQIAVPLEFVVSR